MIFPGIEPIYVFLCPLISASSLTPPNESLINSLLTDLAIDSPNDVFPTPGGPTKQRTGAFIFFTLFCTAKYSSILSFTSLRP